MAHTEVESVLVARLGDGMERYVPPEEPMSRQELRSVAAEALADPSAAAALRTGLAEAHTLGLDGMEADPVFSNFDVNEAARQALIAARPSLGDQILVNPLVKVLLPVDGLTWFSGLRELVERFAIVALVAALVAFAVAFVLADEPTPVLRRAALWVLMSAGFWTVVGPLSAVIVRFTVPSSYILFAIAVETVLQSMRNPAMVMASFGLGMLSLSYAGPAIGRRRGAFLVERGRRRVLTAGQPRSPLPDTVTAAVTEATPSTPTKTPPRAGSVSERLSAAWKEGHGYLDDARVAPFFSGSSTDS